MTADLSAAYIGQFSFFSSLPSLFSISFVLFWHSKVWLCFVFLVEQIFSSGLDYRVSTGHGNPGKSRKVTISNSGSRKSRKVTEMLRISPGKIEKKIDCHKMSTSFLLFVNYFFKDPLHTWYFFWINEFGAINSAGSYSHLLLEKSWCYGKKFWGHGKGHGKSRILIFWFGRHHVFVKTA